MRLPDNGGYVVTAHSNGRDWTVVGTTKPRNEMSNITLETFDYGNGHVCRPTVQFDYEFICPTNGQVGGVIPFLMRQTLQGVCPCGVHVSCLGEVAPAAPEAA